MFTTWCNHNFYLVPKHFHHPSSSHSSCSPLRISWQPLTCFPWIYLSWIFYVNEIIHIWMTYNTLCLFSSTCNIPEFHPCCGICRHLISSYWQIMFHYTNTLYFVCPFIRRWAFRLFPPFGHCEYCHCEHTCTSIWVSVFSFLGYIPRSGIVGSHANSIFSFLGNHQTVFHSGCTISHAHQKCTGAPRSSHPCQQLCLVLVSSFVYLLCFVLLQPS